MELQFFFFGNRVNREAGWGLEIPVMFKFYGKTDYLEILDKLIKISETTRMALCSESKGINNKELARL